jgi:hypothetical protein
MALTLQETEHLHHEICLQLSQTPYACSSLQPLSGGTANFLFRAYLAQVLLSGQETVVIKHSKKFVAMNRDFEFDVARCVCALSVALSLYDPSNVAYKNMLTVA